MNFDIQSTIILLTLAGSHAYGTSTPESDVDVRGICVCPIDVRLSSFHKFEQYEGKWNCPISNYKRYKEVCYDQPARATAHPTTDSWTPPEDIVIYDVAKAIKLIGECNPNMLELLFSDNNDYLYLNSLGEKILSERDKFLSLKAKHTYTGYAMSQLKKIERHRAYLLGKVPKKPTRKEYGLPEHESLIPQAERSLINEEIQNRIREWTADNIELNAAERLTLNENLRSFMCAALKINDDELDNKLEDTAADSLGFNQDVREILRRERGFRNALKSYKSYLRWKNERNPKRKKLEELYGFDSKHAMHLIRLARSGVELLQDGKIYVKRNDADELLSIRNGEKSFEEVKEMAEFYLKRMDELYEKNPCNLPKKIDTIYLDRLTREVILMALK